MGYNYFMKYILAILFLFICQFGMGQVPGTPTFLKIDPIVYTYAASSAAFSSTVISGEIITRGRTIQKNGIIWGTSLPLTFATATGNLDNVTTTSGSKTATITGLLGGTTYYVAFYSTTASSISIGNILAYEHGVVTTLMGRTWMQWNLGATAFPTSRTAPTTSLGGYYQWGRWTDGHESRTSTKFPITSNNVFLSEPVNGKEYIFREVTGGFRNRFLVTTSSTNAASANHYPFSTWLDRNFKPLWQGVNGINNPCPSGYRLPTANEFQVEAESSYNMFTPAAAYASPLKLTGLGMRLGSNGSAPTSGSESDGSYWTSTVNPSDSNNQAYYFSTTQGRTLSSKKINGLSVRCIKDEGTFSSSGGTAKVRSYDCPNSGANGQMIATQQMNSNISQTITADVIEPGGTYDLNAVYDNTKFYASGTFSGSGLQTITLNADFSNEYVGIPSEANAGTNKYYLLNIDPSCVFERIVFSSTSYGTSKITSFSAPVQVSYPGGVMTVGVPVSGVYQNVVATLPLTAAGTYSLTTNTVRGVTFSGSGTFEAGLANRKDTFQLTASGIPTEVTDSASNLYTLNPNNTINYLFGRHIYATGTGTASYSLTAAGNYGGTATPLNMPVGEVISSGWTRRQFVTANVTTAGTYNISATNNGVTFHRAGSFTNTGPISVGLIPTGKPIAAGTFTFTTNTTPSVSFNITF
jgi:hypothetical protein